MGKSFMATPSSYSRVQSDMRAPFVEPEQLLGGFFDSSVVGFSVLDRDLRFLLINPTLARMNGIAADAHLGRTVRELIGEIADTIEPLMRRVFATGEPIVNLELSGTLPTREHAGHWIENYFPIRNGFGDVIQIGAIVIEITPQREAEKTRRLLLGDLQLEKDRLQTLLQIGTLLASSLDLQEVFAQVSSCIRLMIGQELANVSLLDPPTQSVVMYISDFPLAPDLVTCGEQIQVEHAASGQAMLRREPIIFNHAELASMRSSFVNRFLEYGIKSLVCVPLTTPRGTIGSLNLGSLAKGRFLEEDLGFLNTVAGLIALALDNSRAYQEIAKLKDKVVQEKCTSKRRFAPSYVRATSLVIAQN